MAKSPFNLESKGDFRKTLRFLERLENGDFYRILDYYGKVGVEALRDYTPVSSGKTADSWYYEIEVTPKQATITWCNSNVVNGANVVLLLEYGHGTRHGGYVEGIDFVDPAMDSVLKELTNSIWREVEKS